MISALEIFSERKLRPLGVILLMLFCLVPFFLLQWSYVILFLLLVLIAYYIGGNKAGLSLVIFGYSVIFPYLGGEAGIAFYIPHICVFFTIVYNEIVIRRPLGLSLRRYSKISVILILISGAFFYINTSIDELKSTILFLVSTVGVFYVILFDKITLTQTFKVFDFIFILTAIFTLLEVIFGFSPYQHIYNALTLDFQLRAKGLMGHPLVLSAFLSFYQLVLLIRGLILKTWSKTKFFMVLALIILTASRTGIVVSLVTFITFFFITKAYKDRRTLFFFIVSILAFVLSIPWLINYLQNSGNLSRLLTLTADQRVSSYPIAMEIFNNNPFGVGITQDAWTAQIKSLHILLGNTNYNIDFLVFDNSFLTLLVSYGVLSVFLFSIFLSPYFFMSRLTRIKAVLGIYKKALLLIFIVWFVLNLSFDTIFYFPCNAFFFILVGTIFKEAEITWNMNK